MELTTFNGLQLESNTFLFSHFISSYYIMTTKALGHIQTIKSPVYFNEVSLERQLSTTQIEALANKKNMGFSSKKYKHNNTT